MKPVPRAERLAAILELRRKGLTTKQVAERLGVQPALVRNTLYDPDGSKQRERRKRYQGVCAGCGGPTDGSNGYGKASLKCKWCAIGVESPHAALPRLRVPIRLCDVPLEVRLGAVREACRDAESSIDRADILLAALYPSEKVYWVSESAEPMLREMNVAA